MLKTYWSRFFQARTRPNEDHVNRTESRFQRTAQAIADRPLSKALSSLPGTAESAKDDPEAPVFVLSASWRSGSTLLQRLLCSSERILVWGEPYAESMVVQRLADSLSRFTADWPSDGRYIGKKHSGKLHDRWIANLYPLPEDFKAAHRAFFDRLFAEPARRYGYADWGLKEVRFGGREIDYLRWLYPRGRFLLLVRDPGTAWRSYKGNNKTWYERWPERPVSSVTRFARMWQRIADDFVQRADTEGTMLVRYEELGSDATLVENLECFIGARLDPEVLTQRIRGVRRAPQPLSDTEQKTIRVICGKTAGKLGYELN